MNAQTPDIIKRLIVDYLDGRSDAVWQHAQSKQWLIKHRDLEIVAAKAGIEFDLPTMLECEAGKSIAMVVAGRLPDTSDGTTTNAGRMEWSIGEASPKNTQQAYPYAMAEKRAKDRVILKLMNVHGHIYSEEEMSDTESKKTAPAQQKPASVKTDTAKLNAALAFAESCVKVYQNMIEPEDKDGYLSANWPKIEACLKYPAAKALLVDAGLVEESDGNV